MKLYLYCAEEKRFLASNSLFSRDMLPKPMWGEKEIFKEMKIKRICCQLTCSKKHKQNRLQKQVLQAAGR